MSESIIGTIELEGMIEGQQPAIDHPEQALRDWISLAKKNGLTFILELDGNRFSLLPDTAAVPVTPLAPDPAQTIADAVNSLLPIFEDRMPFSTLRSVEYTKGYAVHTLFAISADGKVQFEQRQVEAKTVEPPLPLTRNQKLRQLGIGVGVVIVLFALSTLLIDYGGVYRDLRDTLFPASAESMVIHDAGYQPYFVISKREITSTRRGRILRLTLDRQSSMPKTDDEFDQAYADAKSLAEHLRIEALAKGYVPCELYDHEGKFQGREIIRTRGLFKHEQVVADVFIVRTPATKIVELTY